MQLRQLSPAGIVCGILLVPLAVTALFVLVGPSVDRARAQDLTPKPTSLPGLKSSEEPRSSGFILRRKLSALSQTQNKATTLPQKPSGKMEFVPDSPAPRFNRPPAAARSAANAVVRHQVPDQPAKVAVASVPPPAVPRLKGQPSRTRPVPEPLVVQPESQFANTELEIPEPKPVIPPEVAASSQPVSPSEFSEPEEPVLPKLEAPLAMPTAQMSQRPMLPIDEDEPTEEPPTAPAGQDVVRLFFEEDPSEEDVDEAMQLVEREASDEMELAEPDQSTKETPEAIAESSPPWEIQNVAAQEQPDDSKATILATLQDDEVQAPSDELLAELKLNPINAIEIRKAVEVPPLTEMEDPKLHEPPDQALALLRKRPPFRFWPVYRDPWAASRDSYAFHHNPLWFEEPNLERCGHGLGFFSSGSSALQFCSNISILPYRMTAEPYRSCVRTLPDCTVCEKFGHDAYLPPWSWRAAAIQGAAVTGFIYVVP